jgi:hypothetical protein
MITNLIHFTSQLVDLLAALCLESNLGTMHQADPQRMAALRVVLLSAYLARS